ncbi:hypothetical protein Tco_1048179 [Tanacetum coccineum]
MVDKRKGGSSGTDDDGFIKVKKKISGDNNGGTKNFKPVLMKPKTIFRPKFNQSTAEPRTAPSIGKNNVSASESMEGKCVLVDDDGKPLERANSLGDHNSDDEVESVDNDMARFLASNLAWVGYGTRSLLEQWNESYENDDYDYDPYDNDMYEGEEFPNNLHAICDNLNIMVRGRHKK